MRKSWLLVLLFSSAAASALANPRVDGATITNSGSTNTAGYTIRVWSNRTADVLVRGPQRFGIAPAPRTLQLDQDLTARFFADLQAARENPGVPAHCMKSASFGTATHVAWHDWTSFDLQCPPYGGAQGLLAQDVKLIEAAANVGTVRRLPIPGGLRMIPTAAPEVTPT